MSSLAAAAPTCQHRPQAWQARTGCPRRLSAQVPSNAALAGRLATRRLPPLRPALLPHTRTADAAAAPLQEDSSRARADELVDNLLAAIKDSDGGDNISPEMREQVDGWLKELGEIGDAQALRPLQDPRIFANDVVAYVSTGNKQFGQPAGGRFRGGLGKLLFRTTLLAQAVLRPNLVTNKVAFRLFGFVPGAVGLRGTFVSCPDREGGEDRQDTVKVFFEPPVLSLPGGIHIRIGPSSSVVLKTIYLDERVRLGLGSRGSYFVFTHGGEADAAEMDQVGLQQCSKLGKAFLFALVGLFMVNGAWLVANASLQPVIRAAGLVQVLLGTALGGICYRGGIIQDNEDRPEVGRPGEEQQQQQQQQAAAASGTEDGVPAPAAGSA